MQPNQQQSSPYGALLSYLMGGGKNTAQNAQDILKGTGLQGTYDTQVATGNAATQAGQKVTDAALAGPVNGSYVNAAPMQDTQNQAMIKDSSMPVNLLLGIINQASGLTQNANNNATSATNNEVNAGNTARGLSGQESLNGQTYDPSTNSVGFNGQTGGNGQGGFNPQNVQYLIDHGAQDLFSSAKTPAQQEQLYNEIQNAGGVGAYRSQNKQAQPPGLANTVSGTNDTLNKINYVTNQLKTSKNLQKVLDNPVDHALLNSNNQFIDNSILHLSAADKQALAYMTTLNATNDRAQVGGRLDNYLLQAIGPSSVGKDQLSKTNLTMLGKLKGMITQNMQDTYATPYGYNSVYDIPNLNLSDSSGKGIAVTNSQGQSGYLPQNEVSAALKAGFKVVQ